MVTCRPRVSALDRKLLRDLWEMRGQALAIAAVVAAGVAMFVTYLSNFDSLQRTRDGLLRARSASPTSSPRSSARRRALEARIAAHPRRASRVETRVVADVTLDVPGPGRAGHRPADLDARARPAAAERRVPARGPLARARRGPTRCWPARSSPRPTASSPATASARSSTAAGARLTIVGIALSPEYVYAIRPGEIIPDDRRFGMLWMERAGAGGGLRHGGRLQRRRRSRWRPARRSTR